MKLRIKESGYSGYSMSNNAVAAYDNGEKPLSKWTKSDIIELVRDINPEIVNELKKLPLDVLKKKCLTQTSWHHTSSYYNKTNFYSFDEDYIMDLTLDGILDWQNDVQKPKEPEGQINNKYLGSFDYIEWAGTRKHPKAIKHHLDDVYIEEKGSFYIVTDKNGNELIKKKIGSNGTMVKRINKNIDENRRNTYSGSRFLERAIRYKDENMLYSSIGIDEAVDFEITRDKGGIIVLSTDVNAEILSNNKLVNWIKQKATTIKNRITYKHMIDKRAQEKDFIGWTVGKYLNGRYTAKDGSVFDENSISIEVLGVDFDTLVDFATRLCKDFKQETVLLKDYESGRVVFVNQY